VHGHVNPSCFHVSVSVTRGRTASFVSCGVRQQISVRDVAPALSQRDRVALAGVEVIESRVTHLAYAPEIAQAMLARQQASATVAARFKIVEGAVGMVQNALQRLCDEDVVDLDEERKAHMVSDGG
jgi:hypothetical protein